LLLPPLWTLLIGPATFVLESVHPDIRGIQQVMEESGMEQFVVLQFVVLQVGMEQFVMQQFVILQVVMEQVQQIDLFWLRS
jgi:hypothetical protein